MWLSEKLSVQRTVEQEGAGADMGVTTIGGIKAGVVTRGEQREVPVFAPGGMVWQPRPGDTVLVIKGGSGCEEQCVAAADTADHAPDDMAPGEVFLFSHGGASLFLRSDGRILVKGSVELEGEVLVTGSVTVKGRVSIDGSLVVNGQPYRPCTCS